MQAVIPIIANSVWLVISSRYNLAWIFRVFYILKFLMVFSIFHTFIKACVITV